MHCIVARRGLLYIKAISPKESPDLSTLTVFSSESYLVSLMLTPTFPCMIM